MTYAEALEKLKKRGQEQLLRHYEDLSDAEKAHLLSDIESIDLSVFDDILIHFSVQCNCELARVRGVKYKSYSR